MPECRVEGMVAAEAGADGAEARVLILLTDERDDLVHDVLLVLHLTGDAPTGWDVAVVPAFAVDRVDAVKLEVAVFELVLDGSDHLAVFKLVETAAGGGKDDGGIACVAEDEQLHVAPEGR